MSQNDIKTTLRNLINNPRTLKTILLVVAVALFALCLRKDYELRTQAGQARAQLDNQIDAEFRAIDSLQLTIPMIAADSLYQDADWQFMETYRNEIDSIRRMPAALVQRAVDAAHRRKIMSYVPKSAAVFSQHMDVPGMRAMYQDYQSARHIISEYDKRAPRAELYEARVRRHFDSLMTTQITSHQRKLNELLKKKHSRGK